MKANELMIGDWVIIKTYGVSDKYERTEAYIYVKIAEIGSGLITVEHNNDIKEPYRICENTEIEPIPITLEILEKNGFKKNKTGQWVIEKKHSIGCCGQTCDNTNPLEYAVWWDRFGLGCVSYLEKEGNMTLGGTTYVHQLQQVLRLFDLDKFIKIEL